MLLRLACGRGEKLSFVYKLFPVRWGIAWLALFYFFCVAEQTRLNKNPAYLAGLIINVSGIHHKTRLANA